MMIGGLKGRKVYNDLVEEYGDKDAVPLSAIFPLFLRCAFHDLCMLGVFVFWIYRLLYFTKYISLYNFTVFVLVGLFAYFYFDNCEVFK